MIQILSSLLWVGNGGVGGVGINCQDQHALLQGGQHVDTDDFSGRVTHGAA